MFWGSRYQRKTLFFKKQQFKVICVPKNEKWNVNVLFDVVVKKHT